MVDAYHRRVAPERVYFRELYALLYNINRGEKQAAIAGHDVIGLPGERVRKPPKPTQRTDDEMADLIRRINQS